MLLFQFEGVAEQWLSNDDFANLRAWSSHPDVDAVIADLTRPGALTASLNWYRANVPPSSLVEAVDRATARSRRRRWASGAAATSP